LHRSQDSILRIASLWENASIRAIERITDYRYSTRGDHRFLIYEENAAEISIVVKKAEEEKFSDFFGKAASGAYQ